MALYSEKALSFIKTFKKDFYNLREIGYPTTDSNIVIIPESGTRLYMDCKDGLYYKWNIIKGTWERVEFLYRS